MHHPCTPILIYQNWSEVPIARWCAEVHLAGIQQRYLQDASAYMPCLVPTSGYLAGGLEGCGALNGTDHTAKPSWQC